MSLCSENICAFYQRLVRHEPGKARTFSGHACKVLFGQQRGAETWKQMQTHTQCLEVAVSSYTVVYMCFPLFYDKSMGMLNSLGSEE